MALREPSRTLVVVDRDGTSRTLSDAPRNYQQVAISPNGRRIAVVVKTGLTEWDIWTMDAAGDAPLRRLTVSRFNVWPRWEADNATLLYSAFEERTWRLLSRNVDLNDSPRQLWSGAPQEPRVLGRLRDGSLAYTLVLTQQTLYAVTADGRSVEVMPWDTGRFDRVLTSIVADGQWLAYASNQSGQREAYVTTVAGSGITRQASRNGGNFPVWAKDGSRLFYRREHSDRPDEIFGVTVKPDGSIGLPSFVARGDHPEAEAAFDVFPDGSVLMIREQPADGPDLQVVVNWTATRGLHRSTSR
jgi:Tol biopolymer transport system component